MPFTGLPIQVISMPLALGLDLENAKELVDDSRFLTLENIVFDKTRFLVSSISVQGIAHLANQ